MYSGFRAFYYEKKRGEFDNRDVRVAAKVTESHLCLSCILSIWYLSFFCTPYNRVDLSENRQDCIRERSRGICRLSNRTKLELSMAVNRPSLVELRSSPRAIRTSSVTSVSSYTAFSNGVIHRYPCVRYVFPSERLSFHVIA